PPVHGEPHRIGVEITVKRFQHAAGALDHLAKHFGRRATVTLDRHSLRLGCISNAHRLYSLETELVIALALTMRQQTTLEHVAPLVSVPPTPHAKPLAAWP